jgi:hypothetical protein
LVDLQYALRVSTQHRQTKACIFIYSKMGLYEEAVRMALGDDISLAKENANLPEDREMRKRLWLMIARHIIEDSSSDIKVCLRRLSTLFDQITCMRMVSLIAGIDSCPRGVSAFKHRRCPPVFP